MSQHTLLFHFMISVIIFMLVTQAKPMETLAPYRPPASIFTMYVQSSSDYDSDHDDDDAHDKCDIEDGDCHDDGDDNHCLTSAACTLVFPFSPSSESTCKVTLQPKDTPFSFACNLFDQMRCTGRQRTRQGFRANIAG
jgi:hypothetical protein